MAGIAIRRRPPASNDPSGWRVSVAPETDTNVSGSIPFHSTSRSANIHAPLLNRRCVSEDNNSLRSPASMRFLSCSKD
jgi:hypothetical protein